MTLLIDTATPVDGDEAETAPIPRNRTNACLLWTGVGIGVGVVGNLGYGTARLIAYGTFALPSVLMELGCAALATAMTVLIFLGSLRVGGEPR
jgi:hypothetical protein